MSEPATYQIVLRGRASVRLLRPLIDDFTISHASKGVTILTGNISDPSHLHGVLAHLTSVNGEIISITPHQPGNPKLTPTPKVPTNDSHNTIHNRYTDSNDH